MSFTPQKIIQLAKEQNIRFIRLQFTDILGSLKNVAITVSQLEKALNNQCMFDGSSIEGFVRIEESDMYLRPDITSYVPFPWRAAPEGVARMVCDVYNVDGKPFEGCPRRVLRRVLDEAQQMGYTFNVGPECEFFLFCTDDKGKPTLTTFDDAGYFDMGPVDPGEDVRRDIVLNLEQMGFEIEAAHHECAPGQHEIDFKYGGALETADRVMTFKLAVKTIAHKHGLHATFMPKPVFGIAGSGMHVNLSITQTSLCLYCRNYGTHKGKDRGAQPLGQFVQTFGTRSRSSRAYRMVGKKPQPAYPHSHCARKIHTHRIAFPRPFGKSVLSSCSYPCRRT